MSRREPLIGSRRGPSCLTAGVLAVRGHTRRADMRCGQHGDGRLFWRVVLFLLDDAIRRLGVVARSLSLGASRYLPAPRLPGWSAGSASDIGGHDVRGMAVQGYSSPVVT